MEEYISDNSLYIRSKNNSMINRKMIGRVLGMLLFIELGMFLLCAGVSAGYGESDYKYFLYTCIINAVVGGLLLLYGRGAENKMSRRDAVTILARSVKDMLIKLHGEQPKGACKAMGKFMEAFRDGANTYMLEHIDEIMAGKESKHGR